MSTYITRSDYIPRITERRLKQILDNSEDHDELLNTAEQTAISMVRDRIFERYDVKEIFSRTGEERHKQVVRYTINIVLYIIYERVPDAVTPNRIIKNYDETLVYLDEVNKGVISMDLPRKIIEASKPVTRFRGGSNKRRSH